MDNVLPPLDNLRRIAADPDVRLIPVPSPRSGSSCSTSATRRDTPRPHPILADLDVRRRAIVLALDRQLLVRAVFGEYGEVPLRTGLADPVDPPRRAARRAGRIARRRRGCSRRAAGPTTMATACSTGRASARAASRYPETSAMRRSRWRC